MDSRRTALIALAGAGLLWGLTVPLSKWALEWLGPAWLTVGRFSLAAVPLALMTRSHLGRSVSPAVVAWGTGGYGLVIVVQNLGIEHTSVSHAALIVGAVPVLVALFTLALGRGTSGLVAWTGFGLALVGVALVAGGRGGAATLLGDALVLDKDLPSARSDRSRGPTGCAPGAAPNPSSATCVAAPRGSASRSGSTGRSGRAACPSRTAPSPCPACRAPPAS